MLFLILVPLLLSLILLLFLFEYHYHYYYFCYYISRITNISILISCSSSLSCANPPVLPPQDEQRPLPLPPAAHSEVPLRPALRPTTRGPSAWAYGVPAVVLVVGVPAVSLRLWRAASGVAVRDLERLSGWRSRGLGAPAGRGAPRACTSSRPRTL